MRCKGLYRLFWQRNLKYCFAGWEVKDFINQDDNNDRELFAELNRKYAHEESNTRDDRGQKHRRIIIVLVALFLSVAFLISLIGRWLAPLTGPAFLFLQESLALSGDPLIEELKDSVVQVVVTTGSDRSSQEIRGSGFNLSENGLVVTNRHLVENARFVRVSFYGHGTYLVENIVLSEEVDLALLFFEAEDL